MVLVGLLVLARDPLVRQRNGISNVAASLGHQVHLEARLAENFEGVERFGNEEASLTVVRVELGVRRSNGDHSTAGKRWHDDKRCTSSKLGLFI